MSESFEEVLSRYGELTYTNKGVSMLPMLRQQRDVFTVAKKHGRCKENDVVLYKRGEDYVLHRVVKVYKDHYTLLGDNCLNYEFGVKDDDVLGVLVSFQRDGKRYSIDDKTYRIYVFLLRFFEKPRIFCKKMILKTKRKVKSFIS